MALVYQPRFEGRDRYDFTAYSVACPEVDRTILDLQRFPGKVTGLCMMGAFNVLR